MQIPHDLRAFRVDLDEALKSVCDKYGITIHAGNIRYNSTSFKLSLEAAISAGSPEADFAEKCKDFHNRTSMEGRAVLFKPEDYGFRFKHKTHYFTLKDINWRSVYSAECVRDDGQRVSFKPEHLIRMYQMP